jgi:hypothetical protein
MHVCFSHWAVEVLDPGNHKSDQSYSPQILDRMQLSTILTVHRSRFSYRIEVIYHSAFLFGPLRFAWRCSVDLGSLGVFNIRKHSQLCLLPVRHLQLPKYIASVSHLELHTTRVMPFRTLRRADTCGSTTTPPARDCSTSCSYERNRVRVARLDSTSTPMTINLIGQLPGSPLHHTASGTVRSTSLRPNSHHATQICPSSYASLAKFVISRKKRLFDIIQPIVGVRTRG